MRTDEKLRDKWPWDREVLKRWALIPSGIATALAAVLYPALGVQSLPLLIVPLVALPICLSFGFAGRRVRSLEDSVATEAGEHAESLMVIGAIQAPGIALMKDSELVLIPIVGKRTSIRLADIKTVREVTWLNGKKLWSKKGFLLEVPGHKRLGFAVTETIARRWRGQLAG